MQDLKRDLRERRPIAGGWVTIPHPAIAEITAAAGFDCVLLDLEHTDASLERITNMIRGIESVDDSITTIVRVPWNDPVRIKRVLDLGPGGILVPMVNNEAEAKEAVEAVRYPPDGIRGVAGGRAADYGTDMIEYFGRANDELVTIVQIETEEGRDNVTEIASVDGVDGVFIGPSDLSASMGIFGEWDSETFNDAVAEIVREAHAADTSVSTVVGTSDQIASRADWGVDLLFAGVDSSFLMEANREAKATFDREFRNE